MIIYAFCLSFHNLWFICYFYLFSWSWILFVSCPTFLIFIIDTWIHRFSRIGRLQSCLGLIVHDYLFVVVYCKHLAHVCMYYTCQGYCTVHAWYLDLARIWLVINLLNLVSMVVKNISRYKHNCWLSDRFISGSLLSAHPVYLRI